MIEENSFTINDIFDRNPQLVMGIPFIWEYDKGQYSILITSETDFNREVITQIPMKANDKKYLGIIEQEIQKNPLCEELDDEQEEVVDQMPLNKTMEVDNQQEQIEEIKKKRLPKRLRNFEQNKYFLFKRFDEGIILDEESWYSVVPEDIATHVIKRIKQQETVLDGFCGSGGMSIHLLLNLNKVILNDIDEQQIENAKNNMGVYNCEVRNATFLNQNFLNIEPMKVDHVLLCVPWGGIDYKKQAQFDLKLIQPSLEEVIRHASQFSQSLILQLPKNSKLNQLSEIFHKLYSEKYLLSPNYEVEIITINEQDSQIFVYTGASSQINRSQEFKFLYDQIAVVDENLDKSVIKNDMENGLMNDYLKQIVDFSQKSQNQPSTRKKQKLN